VDISYLEDMLLKKGKQLMRSKVWEHFNSIFYPSSVAVIGASPDFNRLGYHCMLSLIVSKFPGKIYPIHPSLSEIMGFKAYPSIKAAPGEIDLAIIAVRSSLVPALLIECAEKGVKGVVLITAGFKESEEKAGAELQHEVARIANQANIKIIGPNTFGFINIHANLDASFTPEFSLTPKGGISLVSQSGGFCHLMAPLAMEQQVGMSKIIGIGNRCNVDFADILEYLADDPDTKVIMMYVEGTENARQLFEVAHSVTRKKPIVGFKAGRFGLSDKAAYSHTGSMAGSYEVYTAAFEQAGILAVQSSTELLDIAKAFALCPLPKGNRVAVLSAQAGPGMIMSDICEENNLVLANFSPQTTKRLDELLGPLAMRANPVDMGPAWYNIQTIREVIELALRDENIDGVLLYAAYASANRLLLKEITSLLKSPTYGKPLISCFPSPTGVWVEEKQELLRSGVVLYPTPERAAKAMVGLLRRAYRQAKEYPD
jgi:acyl-CoA synthetase (NDP forming)